MAQAKVVSITGEPQHPDALILATVANWKIARSEARLAWAKADRETLFATNDILPGAPTAALARVGELEYHLAAWTPTTTVAAAALLEMVVDMLQERQVDPESTLGDGPALEIAINVMRCLSWRDVPLKS